MASELRPEPGLLALNGELDLHQSPQIRAQLNTLVSQTPAKLIVDLSKVSYIDSSGLAVFIETLQHVHGYGGQLALCGLRPNVRNIFEIARLDQIFRIFPDQNAALAS